MPDLEIKKNQKKTFLKVILQGILSLMAMLALMLLAAGRWDYWQGWLLGGTTFGLMIIGLILFRNRLELIQERIRPGPGTKWWDKIFYVLYLPMNFAVFLVGSLNSGRYHWSGKMPIYVYGIGYFILLLSHFFTRWCMLVNKFFSSTVRIQMDRSQEVVSSGPYQYIRHPGYLGGIFLILSFAFVLGSLWALIPSSFAVLLLLLRTYLEDITLQKELTGYADYAKKVRFRLLPGIW